MKQVKTFVAEPPSITAARRFATNALPYIPAEIRRTVELMVSELATNGIRHGQTSFKLTVEHTGTEIRVAVTDQGGGTPRVLSPTPDEPTGRGLLIVDMLSEQWGVDHATPSGKTVWFTVTVPEELHAKAARL